MQIQGLAIIMYFAVLYKKNFLCQQVLEHHRRRLHRRFPGPLRTDAPGHHGQKIRPPSRDHEVKTNLTLSVTVVTVLDNHQKFQL